MTVRAIRDGSTSNTSGVASGDYVLRAGRRGGIAIGRGVTAFGSPGQPRPRRLSWVKHRTRLAFSRPDTRASVIAWAAVAAPGADANATKKAFPCVSTSTPPSPAHASRTTRRCSARASAYASAPSSRSSFVDPSTSVKRKVTVPVGRSDRRRGIIRRRGSRLTRHPSLATCSGGRSCWPDSPVSLRIAQDLVSPICPTPANDCAAS